MSTLGEGGLLAVPLVMGTASLLVVVATLAMPALAVETLGPVGFLAVALVTTVSLGYVVARFETYQQLLADVTAERPDRSTTVDRSD
jgi:hypothetical protein